MKTFKQLMETVMKTGSGYKLVSKTSGRNLGTAKTLSGIKKREREVQYFKHMKEDGMGGSAGPANAVSTGAIAGTGGKGGEPGVNLKRKKSVIIQPMQTRKQPKM
jgi:hypothetical protein